jgi:hypothetical protein
MSTSKRPSQKICITCEYWGGARNASTFRDSVEYGSDLDKGVCVGGGGGYNRLPVRPMGTCSKWEKWGVLK